MVKVITYGTYDHLHYGHIKLLQRAKSLGDYLIVGVTADDFDRVRGKINTQQSLIERIEAVKTTGIADEIIIEEYEGQKIDDICRYSVDIFTVGSDWVGKFDYLEEYCKVIYLPRTEGVSSSDIRSEIEHVSLGLIGNSTFLNKVEQESHYVNGLETVGIYTSDASSLQDNLLRLETVTEDYEHLLDKVDAVFIKAEPSLHYQYVKKALLKHKHVLCESPFALNVDEWQELVSMAKNSRLVLLDGIKTAYATAYSRLKLLVKSGRIGKVISIDATCTSLKLTESAGAKWDPIYEWGPTALLPVFQLLGTKYISKTVCAHFYDEKKLHDAFTKMDFVFPDAVASIKVANGVKSEGDLVISGTKGYIYVPSPWWNTDYFEIRYEHPENNKRYFYQLDGEGIRFELLCFLQEISGKPMQPYVERKVSEVICNELGEFNRHENILTI